MRRKIIGLLALVFVLALQGCSSVSYEAAEYQGSYNLAGGYSSYWGKWAVPGNVPHASMNITRIHDAIEAWQLRAQQEVVTSLPPEIVAFLDEIKGWSVSEKMRAINDFINDRISHQEDIDQWGHDFWPTPRASLSLLQEDCDGQAIAKFTLAILAGIPSQDVKLAWVKMLNGPHMITIFWDQGEAFVLDNGNLTREIVSLDRFQGMTKRGGQNGLGEFNACQSIGLLFSKNRTFALREVTNPKIKLASK